VFGRRLRIRTKLLLGLIAIGALVVSTAWVVISQQFVVRRSFEIHDRMATIERQLLECRRQEKNFFLREDRASAEVFAEAFESLGDEVRSLRSGVARPEFAQMLTQLETVVASYGEQFTQTSVGLWADADEQERDRLMGATVDAARACHTTVDRVIAAAESTLGQSAHRDGRFSSRPSGVPVADADYCQSSRAATFARRQGELGRYPGHRR
jgi:hypothetical protein